MAVTSTGFDSVSQKLNPSSITGGIERAVKESVEEGATAMKGMIETRGTGKTWTKPWGRSSRGASIPGRVDTGQMRDAVEGKVTSASPTRVEGMVGWEDGSPDYFDFQENSFRHAISGQTIAGMQTLRDVHDIVEHSLTQKLRKLEGI